MAYQYTYLVGDLFLLLIWAVAFFWRRDVRKEMILLSLMVGLLGIFFEFIYTFDWWHPLTITNTRVGLEDFIFGFTIGGISGVIYEEIFKRKIKLRKQTKNVTLRENRTFFLVVFGSLALFLILFYFLKINSFSSSTISLSLASLFVWFKRRDLIVDSLVSGILLVILFLIGFFIVELIFPGWVQSAWYFDNLSGILVLKTPLEDVVWFFLTGLFLGPLYEFWKEGELVNIPSKF